MSPRRRLVLASVAEIIDEAGGSPTMRALSERLRLSRSIVQRHVIALVRDGYLRRTGPDRASGLEVLRLPGRALSLEEAAWCQANPGRVRAMMALARDTGAGAWA